MALPPVATTFNDFLNSADLVLEAFSRCGLRGPAITVNHMADARRSMAALAAAWTTRGVNLWQVKLGTEALVQGTRSYTLTPDVLFLLDAYISTTLNGIVTDRYCPQISRTDYSAIPNKDQEGFPNQVWFDRLTTPVLNFYFNPDGNGPYVFTYYYASQPTDTTMGMGYRPDIPFRMMDAYAADLAERIAEKYVPDRLSYLAGRAEKAWKEASSADRENVPLMILPSLGGYWRRR